MIIHQNSTVESVKPQFIELCQKLGFIVLPGRVPYTYHHDYVRSTVPHVLSRAEVARLSQDATVQELFAFTLYHLGREQPAVMIEAVANDPEFSELVRYLCDGAALDDRMSSYRNAARSLHGP